MTRRIILNHFCFQYDKYMSDNYDVANAQHPEGIIERVITIHVQI